MYSTYLGAHFHTAPPHSPCGGEEKKGPLAQTKDWTDVAGGCRGEMDLDGSGRGRGVGFLWYDMILTFKKEILAFWLSFCEKKRVYDTKKISWRRERKVLACDSSDKD